MGMSKHDAYYEPADGYDDDGARFDSKVADLLRNDATLNPADQTNFVEALSCLTDEQWATVKDYIDQKDWAKLGLKLHNISYEYMESIATTHVQNNPDWLYD